MAKDLQHHLTEIGTAALTLRSYRLSVLSVANDLLIHLVLLNTAEFTLENVLFVASNLSDQVT